MVETGGRSAPYKEQLQLKLLLAYWSGLEAGFCGRGYKPNSCAIALHPARDGLCCETLTVVGVGPIHRPLSEPGPHFT
jgi:hypothetical protein